MKKYLALGVIALGGAVGSTSALADTIVHYDTSGDFWTYSSVVAGTPVLATDLHTNTATSTDSHISIRFDGLTDATAAMSSVDPTSYIQLGTFNLIVNPTSYSGTGNFDEAFVLTVTQTQPSVPGGSSQSLPAALLKGRISATSSLLKLTFAPNSFVTFYDSLGNAEAYSPKGQSLTLVPLTTNNGVVTYQGQLDFVASSGAPSVPLPAAAWGGMGLLGVLGGIKTLRRRSIRQA